MRTLTRIAGAAAVALSLTACDYWLTVPDPTVIDADALDPVADAPLLAKSAQQNFATAYGQLIVYSSWFVGETDVSETFPTRNEFGRRQVTEGNGSLNGDLKLLPRQQFFQLFAELTTKILSPAAVYQGTQGIYLVII